MLDEMARRAEVFLVEGDYRDGTILAGFPVVRRLGARQHDRRAGARAWRRAGSARSRACSTPTPRCGATASSPTTSRATMGEPEYSSADAPLWFILAVEWFARARRDASRPAPLLGGGPLDPGRLPRGNAPRHRRHAGRPRVRVRAGPRPDLDGRDRGRAAGHAARGKAGRDQCALARRAEERRAARAACRGAGARPRARVGGLARRTAIQRDLLERRAGEPLRRHRRRRPGPDRAAEPDLRRLADRGSASPAPRARRVLDGPAAPADALRPAHARPERRALPSDVLRHADASATSRTTRAPSGPGSSAPSPTRTSGSSATRKTRGARCVSGWRRCARTSGRRASARSRRSSTAILRTRRGAASRRPGAWRRSRASFTPIFRRGRDNSGGSGDDRLHARAHVRVGVPSPDLRRSGRRVRGPGSGAPAVGRRGRARPSAISASQVLRETPHPRGAADPAEATPPPAAALRVRRIETALRPYGTPGTPNRSATRRLRPEATAALYGPNLASEVLRYAERAAEIARRERFDVIHAHDWMTFPAGLEARRVSGRPLVVHVHATEYDRAGDGGNPFVREIEREGVTRADRVIAVSRYTAERLAREYGVPRRRLRVVHNAIDGGRPQRRGPAERDSPLVLFAGRVTWQKGPEYFVEAAARVAREMPEARFAVAGSGDRLPSLRERVRQLGLQRNILFTGFLPSAELDRLYAARRRLRDAVLLRALRADGPRGPPARHARHRVPRRRRLGSRAQRPRASTSATSRTWRARSSRSSSSPRCARRSRGAAAGRSSGSRGGDRPSA